MWSWAICTDTCAICRNNLYEPSIEYQATPTGMLSFSWLDNYGVFCSFLHPHRSSFLSIHLCAYLTSFPTRSFYSVGDTEHPGLSIAWGTCGHVFHLDCIQRWLKTRSACPLCNKVSTNPVFSYHLFFSYFWKEALFILSILKFFFVFLFLQEWEFSKIEKIMPGNEGAAAE